MIKLFHTNTLSPKMQERFPWCKPAIRLSAPKWKADNTLDTEAIDLEMAAQGLGGVPGYFSHAWVYADHIPGEDISKSEHSALWLLWAQHVDKWHPWLKFGSYGKPNSGFSAKVTDKNVTDAHIRNCLPLIQTQKVIVPALTMHHAWSYYAHSRETMRKFISEYMTACLELAARYGKKVMPMLFQQYRDGPFKAEAVEGHPDILDSFPLAGQPIIQEQWEETLQIIHDAEFRGKRVDGLFMHRNLGGWLFDYKRVLAGTLTTKTQVEIDRFARCFPDPESYDLDAVDERMLGAVERIWA